MNEWTDPHLLQLSSVFVVQLVVLWGVMAYKTKSAKLSFRDNLEIFDQDVSGIKQQLIDMRAEANQEIDAVKDRVSMSVTWVQCQERMLQETNNFATLEKTLDGISNKIDHLSQVMLGKGAA